MANVPMKGGRLSKKGSNPPPGNAVKPPPPPAPPRKFKPMKGNLVHFSPHDTYRIGHVWSSGKFILKPIKK